MNIQKPWRLKRLAIVTLTSACYGAIAYGIVCADAIDEQLAVQKQNAPATMIVAQSTDQTPASQETATSEGQKSESKTEEKEEAAASRKKPLKDFRPSEQIEAEQAVDFPYDI